MHNCCYNRIKTKGGTALITIEALQPEDMQQMIALYQELIPPHIPFDASLQQLLQTYERMRNNSNSFLAVAKEDGTIVGSALGICCQCLVGTFLVVEDVIVCESQRGKGIGRQLMKALDAFAQSHGCTYSLLVSSDFRKGAHQFYENIGYNDGVVGFRKLYHKP